MKKLVIGVVGLFLGLGAHAAELKVGYLDMQKAIQATEAGKKAKKELESDFNSKKKKLEQKEKDLKAMKEELEKKAMALTEEARDKRQKDFQEKMFEYQKMVQESQMSIQGRERELTGPILDKLRKVIDKMAADEGYTVILEKNEQSVLWAKKDIDITDKVVAAFEKDK